MLHSSLYLSSSSLSALLRITAGLASPVTRAEAVLLPTLLEAVQLYSPVELSLTSGMVRVNWFPLEEILSSGVSRVMGVPSRAQSTSSTGGYSTYTVISREVGVLSN